MDLLSEVLRDLRVQGVLLSVSRFRAPWGFEKDALPGATPFYIVMEGHCSFGAAKRELRLGPGDLLLLPHGTRHCLQSDASAELIPFHRLLQGAGIDPTWSPNRRMRKLGSLNFGGSGALTRMLVGMFVFGDGPPNPLFGALPPVIHSRPRSGKRGRGSHALIQLLLSEAQSAQPGFQMIAERLADALLARTLCDYAASLSKDAGGWLRGLRDPHVARALSLLHDNPAVPWTIASLATAVGLSRTNLAQRFGRLVGSGVITYLTQRRMYVAAQMLRHTRHSIAKIANAVGYESEIAFNRAFRRWSSSPPGRYRSRAHQG